jgi:hypothetical protein
MRQIKGDSLSRSYRLRFEFFFHFSSEPVIPEISMLLRHFPAFAFSSTCRISSVTSEVPQNHRTKGKVVIPGKRSLPPHGVQGGEASQNPVPREAGFEEFRIPAIPGMTEYPTSSGTSGLSS